MPFPSYITTLLSIVSSATKDVSKLEHALNCTAHPLSDACLGWQVVYLDSVCSPPTANASLDLTYPCNQQTILREQCTYGKTLDQIWNTTSGDWAKNPGDGWTAQSVENQRLCACESDFFDTLAGCSDCYSTHGATIDLYDEDAVSSISSSYCAASATPTVGLEKMLAKYGNDTASSVLSVASDKASTSTFSDPMMGSTAVSYYYTPAVTGTAVFDIAGVTKGAEPTETNVSHGQITSENGAVAFGGSWVPVKVAAAALLGLAGVVAML